MLYTLEYFLHYSLSFLLFSQFFFLEVILNFFLTESKSLFESWFNCIELVLCHNWSTLAWEGRWWGWATLSLVIKTGSCILAFTCGIDQETRFWDSLSRDLFVCSWTWCWYLSHEFSVLKYDFILYRYFLLLFFFIIFFILIFFFLVFLLEFYLVFSIL